MPRVDVHQHAWPDALVEELGRRSRTPRIVDDLLLLVTGYLAMRLREPDHSTATARRIASGLVTDL